MNSYNVVEPVLKVRDLLDMSDSELQSLLTTYELLVNHLDNQVGSYEDYWCGTCLYLWDTIFRCKRPGYIRLQMNLLNRYTFYVKIIKSTQLTRSFGKAAKEAKSKNTKSEDDALVQSSVF